jgi:DNA integrity scanning protein DisA with diadenylate cyclase activity
VYGGGPQVLQTLDWYRIVIDAPADKEHSATTPSLTVRRVVNIVSETERPVGRVRLVQEAYVDAMLTEYLVQLQLSCREAFSPFDLLGRAVILRYKEDNGL